VTTSNPGDEQGEPLAAPAEKPEEAHGGPGPFTEAEIASATGPVGDPEMDGVEPADIDEKDVELETPFEKLAVKSKRLSAERTRTVIESLLFVADKPLTLDQLYESTGFDRKKIEAALGKLGGIHREGVSGTVLHEVAGGWQFRTDPGSSEYVRRFLRVKPQRLTRAAVETMAIIAYRQPVTRPEVEEIRGVDSGAVVKALLDRRLIKILGKKEEVGRPILYGTTREFLEFFALRDLASLPTLREFQELSEEHAGIVEKETPGPKPAVEGTVAALSDPGFEKKLEESRGASDAALAELESAISNADQRAKTTATFLNIPEPTPEAGTPQGPNAAPEKPEST
jgi:segregation and condensation protein B